jgi:hypothetical protein
MTVLRTRLAYAALAACGSLTFLGCARSSAVSGPAAPPAFLLGSFTDDYGSRYTISAREWTQGSRARYRIVRWDVAGQFAIAQNDAGNPSDPGLWTRIDWLPLPGMSPYTWGYCYSAYKAPSAAIAETVSVAKRSVPRTGCNGFPFSRMRAVADSGK